MIWEIEADMVARADDIYLGLDIENAFGSTRRSDAHAEARECSTPTAQLQWNQWYGGAQQLVWVQIGNSWRSLRMQMGVCQGGCSAKQDFTLAFARAQRTADARLAAVVGEHPGTQVQKRLYMDDECLRTSRSIWKPSLQAVRTALAKHGYRLRLDKTKAHCPRAREDDSLAEVLRSELAGYAEFVQQGLPLLGKVADGELSTGITASGPLLGPAEKRMEAACELASQLHALADAELEGRKLGPFWARRWLCCLPPYTRWRGPLVSHRPPRVRLPHFEARASSRRLRAHRRRWQMMGSS